MALPSTARYPDRPLVEEEPPRPRIVAQRFTEPDLAVGRAEYRERILPDPGVGSDFADVRLTTRHYVQVISFIGSLDTDANVANRFPELRFLNQNGTLKARATSNVAIVSPDTVEVSAFIGASSAFSFGGNRLQFALPDHLFLLPGDIIRFLTIGIQAGDQWQAGMLYLRMIPIPEGVS